MKKVIVFFIFFIASSFCTFSYGAQKIRFGVIYFYPPFVFASPSGYVHGFDIDIATAICQQMHAECTFTAMPLNKLFTGLDNNKFDALMGAISITPSRQLKYDFSRPYFKSSMSYVALSSSNIIPSPQMLHNKTIGVIKDSTFYAYLAKTYSGTIHIKVYDTNQDLMTALSNHGVDLVLIDTPVANYWVGFSMGLFKTVGNSEYLPLDQGYGIVVKKGNVQLVTEFNNALDIIFKNGTFNKIMGSYFFNQ